MPTLRRPAGRTAAVVVMVLGLAAGCGSDGRGGAAGARAEQVRTAALDAGLAEEVADVLALAARGASATCQVTYAGPDGTSLVVSQDPPRRRVDALQAGLIVESHVLVDGTSYRCTLPGGSRPGDDLRCRRVSAAPPGTGTFTEAALAELAADLAAGADQVETTVDTRTIAGEAVTCLGATPRPETVPPGTDAATDTICLSDEGVQLLVDVGGERLVADAYLDEVPAGTFDL